MLESKPGTPLHLRRLFWAGALLFGVTAIAYIPAYRGGFVFDDVPFLVENSLIKAGGGLYRFWFSTQQADFWPVTYSAFWIEWRLWGTNAMGYHAVNVALHVSDALLLWAILRRLRFPGAYLAAFLFAVHPVNVESVAWIIQLKNLMAMLFYLATIWCFLKTEIALPSPVRRSPAERDEGGPVHQGLSERRISTGWYLLSLLCFILAMLSKGSVAVLPVVLLGLIAWRRRLSITDLGWALPYFAVSVVLVLTDMWFQKHGLNEVFRNAGFLERLLGAGAAVWFYLYKALLPVNLVFVYPQWHIRAGDPLWWVPLAAGAGVTAALFRYRARFTRAALFAWGYFCAALVPVMGFTDVYFMKFSLVADHYQHLAIIGVIGLVAAGWEKWRKVEVEKWKVETWKQTPSSVRSFHFPLFYFHFSQVAAAALIGILAALTWRQCEMYRDSETLWSKVLETNPRSLLAQNSLGNAFYSSGRVPEAIARYREELRIDPDFPDAHNNLGMVMAAMGRFPEATAELEEALRVKPIYPEALINLGNVLQKEGRNFEAIADYEKALKLEPLNAEAHSDLGIALAGAGQWDDAIGQFEEALRLEPDYADAFCNLGGVLAATGRLPDAIADYQQALRLKPDDAAARAGLGAALADSGRVAEAVAQYEQAVRLSPGHPEIHYNLGSALAQTGRTDEAIAQFQEAARLKPDYAEAHANLGAALAGEGRLPEALVQLEQAAQLNPGYAQVHYNLGAVLRALGREDEAKAEFDKAARLGSGH